MGMTLKNRFRLRSQFLNSRGAFVNALAFVYVFWSLVLLPVTSGPGGPAAEQHRIRADPGKTRVHVTPNFFLNSRYAFVYTLVFVCVFWSLYLLPMASGLMGPTYKPNARKQPYVR